MYKRNSSVGYFEKYLYDQEKNLVLDQRVIFLKTLCVLVL
jgi:hypothetical protein